MATTCTQCGASLPDGQMFCTSCGTPRSEPTSAQANPRFCTSCGAPAPAGTKFCHGCGSRLEASAPTPNPQPAPVPNVAPSATPASASQLSSAPSQPTQKKPMSFVFKLVIVALCLFGVGVLAMTAGAVYIGYVAKKRVAAVKEAIKHDDVGGVIAAAKGDAPSKPQPLPDWKPVSSDFVSSAADEIPLRASLQLLEASSDQLLGDYEAVYRFDKLNDHELHITASEQFPAGQGFARFFADRSQNTKEELNKLTCGRTIYMKDLESSAETDGYFCRQRTTAMKNSSDEIEGYQERHPGTTAMGFSKKTLQELRATGQTEFKFHQDPLNAVFSSLKNVLTAPDDQASTDKAAGDLLQKMMNFAPSMGTESPPPMETPAINCTLHRVGPDLAFPVLVNDQPTELPVMHVVCKPPDSDREAHLYVLDDIDNPLIMAVVGSTGGHGQVTQIRWDFPARTGLEEELSNNECAKVYDLYFDFRSDVLRPESDKVLKEIAHVLQDHPDWKLTVKGHTDNIGGDTFNLDLSKRRAAAVKNGLVKKYAIVPDRLLTDGFGRSRPVDTNDTLEGRARNRRVELCRGS